jgi:hypothetical protein
MCRDECSRTRMVQGASCRSDEGRVGPKVRLAELGRTQRSEWLERAEPHQPRALDGASKFLYGATCYVLRAT